jgi:membrane-bound serine protease (ClpP class)
MKALPVIAGTVLLLCLSSSAVFAGDVFVVSINGVINPPSATYLCESIKAAGEKGAEAIVVLLDTPGGLDTSMREIIKAIMESAVPVIVYVHPSGARAASAGAVILLASHVAAMTPGTNVGAAHPVSIGKDKADKEMMQKVVKDAEAYVRSIALKRGRNADWAAKAVKESASIAAGEALDKKVIDVVVKDLNDLLEAVDGRTVETKTGRVKLDTREARRVDLPMPFKYRFLSYLSDPNVAYILMMIGIYGILFEIYSPGAIFPAVAGGISIILALYAFQTIPISYAGLSLILLGVIFFILELKIVSHGVLGIAGIVSIVIGSIMLIDLPGGPFSISWTSIAVVAILSGIFFFGVLSYAIRAQLSKVKTGREGLIGESGLAKTDISPEGIVLIHGERWNATSDEPVAKGDTVTVLDVKGLKVKVKKEGRP